MRDHQRTRKFYCTVIRQCEGFRSCGEGTGRVDGILHGLRIIGRSVARNSVIPRVENSLVLINWRLADAIGNQAGPSGHPSRRGGGWNIGTLLLGDRV